MKLHLMAASVAFALSSAVSAQTAAPAKPAAAKPAAPAAARPATAGAAVSDRAALSYAIGYRMARDLADRKVDLDVSVLAKGVQEGYAKKDPTMPVERLGAALQQFQTRMAEEEKKERAEFERVSRENKTKSDAFMASNRGKPGVTVLPSGVQYRVIEAGTGAKPTANSTVTMHLRGTLPTGEEFASTQRNNAAPPTFKVTELPLPGMKDVVMQMPAGSRWEVFLPPEQAWGNDPRSPVGPGQAVVFELRLISAK